MSEQNQCKNFYGTNLYMTGIVFVYYDEIVR